MILELKNVTKDIGGRRLFRIDNLKVYSGDRIGVVGPNGAGKTTLLQIMAGLIQPDEGTVCCRCPLSYINQLDSMNLPTAISNPLLAQQLKVNMQYTETMSGGEKTRYKIAAALSENPPLLLADEPTANLDIQGIETLQKMLREFEGALVIVSHDRELLETECNIIWEMYNGDLKVYKGSFRDYLVEKQIERKQQEAEYDSYTSAKKKLEEAVADRKKRSISMRKTPKRMGNSEARLHKMGNQKAKANLNKAVKAMETRLKQLDVKGKPPKEPTAVFNLTSPNPMHSKVVLRGEGVSKSYGSRMLFNNAQFSIFNGQKVALIGANGCGKTTLLKMMVEGEAGFYTAPKVCFGYLEQEMQELDINESVITNVMNTSIYDEGFVRSILARLLFKKQEVFKPVGVMSGGERTRIALAKIIVSEANFLVLDEPTNYLDLPTITALESVLAEYKGVVLFASHDRKFINNIATHLMLIEDGKIQVFEGTYNQFLEHRKEEAEKSKKEAKLLLEYRLAEVLSKLAVAKDKKTIERLDQEYQELLAKG